VVNFAEPAIAAATLARAAGQNYLKIFNILGGPQGHAKPGPSLASEAIGQNALGRQNDAGHLRKGRNHHA
jgi:hypothetical protein